MRQILDDTRYKIAKASNITEMILLALAMNARLPVEYHVRIGANHHRLSLLGVRRYYLQAIREKLTFWDIIHK